jgi:hypothetical protein
VGEKTAQPEDKGTAVFDQNLEKRMADEIVETKCFFISC